MDFSPTIFGPSTLVELVQYRASVQADDLAFIYLANGIDDEIPLTNAELDRRARRIAAWLQEHNCQGERILLLYPPGLDFITAFFGCLYAGAIAVPIYPPRKNRSMLRIQAVAQNATAKIALTTRDTLERVGTLIHEAPDLQNILWFATDTMPNGGEDLWRQPDISEKTIAFLQYTSGSTGTPKGVVLSHGNMIHNSRLIQLGFEHTRHDLGVFWLPSYHDMGLIGGVLQPLYCGRPNVLISPLSFLQKPFRWLAAITRYGATTSGGPNFAYDLCVRQIKDELLDQLDLSTWKVAFNGAEPIQPETLENFTRKFERCGFRYNAFYPCFGLAEATLIVSGGYASDPPLIKSFEIDALSHGKVVESRGDSKESKRFVSSGTNFSDQIIRIVNPETLKACPGDEVGEIWVKGPSMAQGYWKAPEATETTFRARLSDTGEGPFMRTGDLGFLDGEELFVTGRIKDMIIIRGVNIYPQDIEETVWKSDPHLRVHCGAAFMIEDGMAERLVIVQEVERRFKGDMTPLFEAVRTSIATEHEFPVDAIVFVKTGSIPKTSSGKIQRHACRKGFLEGTLSHLDSWESSEMTVKFVPKEAVIQDDVLGGDGRGVIQPVVRPPAEQSPPAKSDTVKTPNRSFAEALKHERAEAEKRLQEAGITKVVVPAGENKPVSPPSTIPLGSDEEIVAVVVEIVKLVAKDRAAGMEINTDITTLGLDSLERMEILASLEDRFGGRFPEQILPDLLTARQVADAARKYLGVGADASEFKAYDNSRMFEEKPVDRRFARPLTYNLQPDGEITEERYKFEQFPEYKLLHGKLELVRNLGLNHFFDVHEGTTRDTTVIGGKEYINFSSYNYVDTSGDPAVVRAAQEACEKFGTSVSASRMVSGEKPVHRELETAISRFLGTEDTIVMVGGHSTNESVIGHLLSAEDMILHDALAHNSIVQGAILSGARRRPFPHNNWEAAEEILSRHRNEYRRVMIIVEGVYSMDGDYPDLPKLIEVKKRHKAMLMVDEAHSIGVLGKTGRGIGEHFPIDRKDVDVWMSTLSKTFGSCGGYISGSRELIEYLKYTAPGFVFSVGISPPNAAAALASLQLLEREPERVERLRQNAALLLQLAKDKGLNTGLSRDSAVVPVIIGNSMLCLQLSKALFDRGINVQPILHPAVEEKAARLRFFVCSSHKEEQIRFTIDATAEELEQLKKA
ncbi:MAG: aminotransferase class I/II-fold pyridoxal phosphate-dependent enzyme [Planctomycetaceae bacterium]|nr:aminotransferase class I/II-fold pyridoxal phosphate-dependent enzyme [Planctomycetaceae bacterium]